ELDIAHLLPPFPRKRIYTYPSPSDPYVKRRDCVWTAMNFLNDKPDNRFMDPELATKVLDAEYDPVMSPHFGDVVVLADEQNVPIHLANYIADDLVYTKNGAADGQPWMLMKLEALRDLYSAVRSMPVRIVFMRRSAQAISESTASAD